MTCLTCHNPHDVPRGEAAVQHYTAACQSCHKTVHAGGTPQVAGAGPRATCIDCHMPRRRTDDAVHVVMTDHFIQRVRPARDLTAPLEEAATLAASHYQGEVALYYPTALPPTPETELYLALAQVQQGANLAAGIPRLQTAIERHGAAPTEFYYELARAYAKAGNQPEVIRWSEAALARDATFAPALKELAGAATALGQWDRAIDALRRAVTLRPNDSHALADLGNVYLQRQQVGRSRRRPWSEPWRSTPACRTPTTRSDWRPWRRATAGRAEQQFREAIRIQPDLAEAHNNLAKPAGRTSGLRRGRTPLRTGRAPRPEPRGRPSRLRPGAGADAAERPGGGGAAHGGAAGAGPGADPHGHRRRPGRHGRTDEAMAEYGWRSVRTRTTSMRISAWPSCCSLGAELRRRSRILQAAATSPDAAVSEAARARLSSVAIGLHDCPHLG